LKRLFFRPARRVYFTSAGPADLGTVTATQRLNRAGRPAPDGELYLRVRFDADGGQENWFHHTLLSPA
jgi:hypothetical protein